MCKHELSGFLFIATHATKSEWCNVVRQMICAYFVFAVCLYIDANVKCANLFASRFKHVNKSHVSSLLGASFAATVVSRLGYITVCGMRPVYITE